MEAYIGVNPDSAFMYGLIASRVLMMVWVAVGGRIKEIYLNSWYKWSRERYSTQAPVPLHGLDVQLGTRH